YPRVRHQERHAAGAAPGRRPPRAPGAERGGSIGPRDHRHRRSGAPGRAADEFGLCPRIEGGVKVVVIGNGMVGQRFLEELAKRSPDADITVFCEEPRPAYDRVQLTSYFGGKSAEDLSLAPKKFFQDSKVTLRLNDAVLGIDAQRKVVRSARYKDVPYDKLVLATGSYPFVPPVAGKDRRDCF